MQIREEERESYNGESWDSSDSPLSSVLKNRRGSAFHYEHRSTIHTDASNNWQVHKIQNYSMVYIKPFRFLNGFELSLIAFDGHWWLLTVFDCLWSSLLFFDGLRWSLMFPMVSVGILWFPGLLWSSMVFYGPLRPSMVSYGLIEDHQWSTKTIIDCQVKHHLRLLKTIKDHQWLSKTIRNYPKFTMVLFKPLNNFVFCGPANYLKLECAQ